jgi:hypothetical protein
MVLNQKYTDNSILGLINDGFMNVVPVLDNMDEFDAYQILIKK